MKHERQRSPGPIIWDPSDKNARMNFNKYYIKYISFIGIKYADYIKCTCIDPSDRVVESRDPRCKAYAPRW
jgi:hypothetical protein